MPVKITVTFKDSVSEGYAESVKNCILSLFDGVVSVDDKSKPKNSSKSLLSSWAKISMPSPLSKKAIKLPKNFKP